MTTYKPRFGNLVFLNFFVIIILVLSPLHEKGTLSWVVCIVGILFLVELVVRILTTSYFIDNKNLIVKSGIWINKKIDISSLKKVTRTDDIGRSAAFALGSLRIIYGNGQQVTISPKNKKQFLKDLTSIQPDLVMKGKPCDH